MGKYFMLLSSAFILMACDTSEPEEVTPEENPTEEVDPDENGDTGSDVTEDPDGDIEENPDSNPNNDDTNNQTDAHSSPVANLINKNTFMEPYALQAWNDYQVLVNNVTYGESTVLYEENPDFSVIEGTSLEEMTNQISAINLREDVYTEKLDLNETEEIHYYRYPAEADSAFSEISDFLAELTFYYIEDNLLMTAITPGYYSLELDNLPDAQTMTTFLTVDEIEALDSKVFTIASMKINGNIIRQIMMPANFIDEEGNEQIVAFYFFAHEEDIVQYAYLPFETVMQSFPDYSVLVYQEIIPTIADLNI